jgi:OmpA-OmpF porin, OOP family
MSLRRAAYSVPLALGLAATNALAQSLPSLDVRTWRPTTDPEANLVLEPMSTPGWWNFNVGAWLSYANRPVALTAGGSSLTSARPLENQLAMDLVANVGLGARAAVGVDLPMFLYQNGTTGLSNAVVTNGSVPATGLGDLTVTGKGAIITNQDGGFGLAVLGAVSVPTGDTQSFMGEGSTTVTARVAVDYSLVIASLQASFGYMLRSEHHLWPDAPGGIVFGDELPWSIGLLLHPGFLRSLDPGDRQTWELAFHGALPAGPVGPFGTGQPGSQALSPALFAFSDRISLGRYRDTFVLLGGDVGVARAVGVPTFRGIVALGWAPRSHDRDGDGVPDDVDQCPGIAEDRDGFEDNDGCPEMDNDEDGIPDAFDACPLVKGIPDPDPKRNGCPKEPVDDNRQAPKTP